MATISLHTQSEEMFQIRTTDGNIAEIKADGAIIDTIGNTLEIIENPCIKKAVFNWSQVVSIKMAKKKPDKVAYIDKNGKIIHEVLMDE